MIRTSIASPTRREGESNPVGCAVVVVDVVEGGPITKIELSVVIVV
jgi:hypothetical protein